MHSANTRVVLPTDHGVSGSAVEDSSAVHTLIENLLIAYKRCAVRVVLHPGNVDGRRQGNQPSDLRSNGLKMDPWIIYTTVMVTVTTGRRQQFSGYE